MRELSRVGSAVAGKYRMVRAVGSGEMADVYEAAHVETGKRVSLKLVKGSSEERLARFRREVIAASTIESKYVVEVYDAGDDPRLGLYIVTELLVGEDLAARLARVRVVQQGEAVAIAGQVARGLADIHAAGVVHGHLEPGNLFLTARDDGSLLVKLLDFGASRMRDSAESHLDGRPDVEALAACLFEMLTGVAACSGAAQPLRTMAPHISPALCDLVEVCLAGDPGRRPDAAAFASALLHARPETTPGARARSTLPSCPAALRTVEVPRSERDPVQPLRRTYEETGTAAPSEWGWPARLRKPTSP
jgi:serine/threonine-protein kinase